MTKTALVVRVGWDGHSHIAATDLYIPFLEMNGFTVRTEDSTKVYAGADYLETVDLTVQCVSMSTIEREDFAGLAKAIERGTGLAGWHGGIADSFRNNSDYLHLIGGQFACHPGKLAEEHVGYASDNFIPYRVNMLPAATSHPITEGIADFNLVTEQYWVLADEYIDVLATTTLPARETDPWHRAVTCPAIWTRQWGQGNIFVAIPGHDVATLQNTNVKTIVERGLLWASR